MMSHQIENEGYAIVRGVIAHEVCVELAMLLGECPDAGRRGILSIEAIAKLARSEAMMSLLSPHLKTEPRPVRGIYFDKSANVNWRVAWHQDVTIAVREKRHLEGFGPWSIKDGVPHVQPPESLLGEMLTARIHLDSADETNGALRVIPGSHRFGKLTGQDIAKLRESVPEVLCSAGCGDVLLMRPLLLHASGRSASGRRRRVIHIEYAPFDLPAGLAWAEGCRV